MTAGPFSGIFRIAPKVACSNADTSDVGSWGGSPEEEEVGIHAVFRRDEGFTLVELMVVVLIIGILVAIAIPVFNAATKTARERTCHSNERTVEGAVEQYLAADPNYTVTGDDWDAIMGKLVPDYIKAEPTCPEGGTYTFDDTAKTVTCSVHGHF